jgi:hypothetical protein
MSLFFGVRLLIYHHLIIIKPMALINPRVNQIQLTIISMATRCHYELKIFKTKVHGRKQVKERRQIKQIVMLDIRVPYITHHLQIGSSATK